MSEVEITFTHEPISGDCQEAEREIASLRAALAAASEREQAYRAALTFYADETTYRCQWTENGSVTPIDEDHGDQARAILAAQQGAEGRAAAPGATDANV